MRHPFLPLPAALAGVLLLTACGTGQHGGSDARPPSGAPCPGQPSGASAAPLPGDPAEPERDGVRITGFHGGDGGCALFEVTHAGTEPHTYTVTFALVSEAGTVLDTAERTVAGVGPGRTVSGRIPLDTAAGPQDVSRVGKLGVGPWKKREAGPQGGPSSP
ncbi:hypothetical protein ACFV2D_21990 [Streptomyces capillispiralis]|uniref:hypothetical protein n=1 Tax=Streptomyces capillispiralis TaxID=68182 RepID=UPI0036739D20